MDDIDDFQSFEISSHDVELAVRKTKKTGSYEYLRLMYHAFLDMEVDKLQDKTSPYKDIIDESIIKIYGNIEGEKLIEQFISDWV